MMFRGRVRHIHFVGVGGVGMSGIAEILRSLEFEVSGSDLREGANTLRLASLGVRIDVGHEPGNVHGSDVVVCSTAIKGDNPEVVEAKELGIPVIGRADMLAELRDDNLKLVEILREAKEAAGAAGDNATDGLLDDWTDQAEERAWFLFEASRNG